MASVFKPGGSAPALEDTRMQARARTGQARAMRESPRAREFRSAHRLLGQDFPDGTAVVDDLDGPTGRGLIFLLGINAQRSVESRCHVVRQHRPVLRPFAARVGLTVEQ